MDNNTYQEKKVGKYTVKVVWDTYGDSSPREWENLGKFKSFSRYLIEETKESSAWLWIKDIPPQYRETVKDNCYSYGDGEEYEFDFNCPEHFELWLECTGAIWYRISAHIHGGMTISANSGRISCPFDSGYVGYYWVSRKDALKEYGYKIMCKSAREKVEKILLAEISTFDDYLTGQVFGYIVEDEHGEQLDSCWGFLGDADYCMQEGESAAKWQIKKDQEEARKMAQRLSIARAIELPVMV